MDGWMYGGVQVSGNREQLDEAARQRRPRTQVVKLAAEQHAAFSHESKQINYHSSSGPVVLTALWQLIIKVGADD